MLCLFDIVTDFFFFSKILKDTGDVNRCLSGKLFLKAISSTNIFVKFFHKEKNELLKTVLITTNWCIFVKGTCENKNKNV